MSNEYIIHLSCRGGSIAQQQRVYEAHYQYNGCKDPLTRHIIKLLEGRRVVFCYFGEKVGGDTVFCDSTVA
jgi:hypothetical protein